jgi:hypothetical protein
MWFNILKSINVTHYMNKVEDKTHMIMSTDVGKGKNSTPFLG